MATSWLLKSMYASAFPERHLYLIDKYNKISNNSRH
jgi:hypothetical protein